MSQDFKVISAGGNFEPVIQEAASSAVEFVLWVVETCRVPMNNTPICILFAGFARVTPLLLLNIGISLTTKSPPACVHSGSRISAIRSAPLRTQTAATNVNYNEMWRKTQWHCTAKPTRRNTKSCCPPVPRMMVWRTVQWLKYTMQQSFWEANQFSVSQEIPRSLWNSKVHYRV